MTSGALIFEMHASDATPKEIEMRLEGEPLFCRLFLSADERYAAVGVYLTIGNEDAVKIGVFDRSTGKWASNFVVRQREDLLAKLRFNGFLGDTSKLVVTGIGKSKPREDVKFKVLIFGVDGQPAAESGLDRILPRSNRSWDVDSVDARHNRLWFVGSPQFCPVKSVMLSGPAGYGPSITEAAVGGIACLPTVIGFPKVNAVVGGNSGNQNWVWRVDLDSGTGEKLELPQSKPTGQVKWNSYAMSPIPEFSPDGEVFALGRSVTVWDTFDRSRDSGGELDIIQSKPLKVLGVIPLKDGCGSGSVAVDHRNGSTTVLQRRCGKWERDEFPKR
ncbi:MAG TPA: hypothetical protein VMG30_12650 [Acidobacteriota bacterium]|nr:hypothetical protein [Acidobacteriota bacterium]